MHGSRGQGGLHLALENRAPWLELTRPSGKEKGESRSRQFKQKNAPECEEVTERVMARQRSVNMGEGPR